MVQNNDIQLRFTLVDIANTAYIIDNLANVEIYVYQLDKFNNKLLKATFKKSNTGIYNIAVADSANGVVSFIINRELSRQFSVGKVYAEVRIGITGGSWIASRQNTGLTGNEIFEVYSTANPNSLT